MPRHSPCALYSLIFVGAKSAQLRFRLQPIACGENCARFLAPPPRSKLRFERISDQYWFSNYAGSYKEVFGLIVFTLKLQT